ncbi:hypothetical protein [Streptomyces sp. NPDC020983]|uniref:hypothetical protein n=1 Tax=Streptomyces sp. NPDC020983 TaxID=3365106 RepID=UPI00378E4788
MARTPRSLGGVQTALLSGLMTRWLPPAAPPRAPASSAGLRAPAGIVGPDRT